MFTLEACVDDFDAALTARNCGANRIELCSALALGGLTPSVGTMRMCRHYPELNWFAMVRPRAGDFMCSDYDFAVMKEELLSVKELGAKGLVMGILTPQGKVDVEGMAALMALAGDLPVTFHRAFDRVREPEAALEDLIGLGVQRVLTSGGAPTALEGADMLAKLVKQANGRIVVMPGGKVNAENVVELAQRTGAKEFHFSAVKWQSGEIEPIEEEEAKENAGEPRRYERPFGMGRKVRAIRTALENMHE